jgi:hypothetical protein
VSWEKVYLHIQRYEGQRVRRVAAFTIGLWTLLWVLLGLGYSLPSSPEPPPEEEIWTEIAYFYPIDL